MTPTKKDLRTLELAQDVCEKLLKHDNPDVRHWAEKSRDDLDSLKDFFADED